MISFPPRLVRRTYLTQDDTPQSVLRETFIITFATLVINNRAWLLDPQGLFNGRGAVGISWKKLCRYALQQKCIKDRTSINTPHSLCSKPDKLVKTPSQPVLWCLGADSESTDSAENFSIL